MKIAIGQREMEAHGVKDLDLQDNNYGVEVATEPADSRDSQPKRRVQSTSAAATRSAPTPYTDGTDVPQPTDPDARCTTAAPIFSQRRYGAKVAPVALPVDDATNTTPASTSRQHNATAAGATVPQIHYERQLNGTRRNSYGNGYAPSYRARDRPPIDPRQNLWYLCVIVGLLAFVVGFFLGALLESSTMHLFDVRRDAQLCTGEGERRGIAETSGSAQQNIKGAAVLQRPQQSQNAQSKSENVAAEPNHSVPQPVDMSDTSSFDHRSPHCPFGHNMMGKIGSTQTRLDALPIRVANAYGCRDLCHKIRTCMRAVFSQSEANTCYLELTDQIACDLDGIKVSRICPPTNGSCVGWSKNCKCPTISNEQLSAEQRSSMLIVDTYLDHVANTIKCASEKSNDDTLTSAKYFMDACNPRKTIV